ncbi:MAG: hypothetical protein GY720_01645 [bacterium]|nr:hypothetical protein [bacterium]
MTTTNYIKEIDTHFVSVDGKAVGSVDGEYRGSRQMWLPNGQLHGYACSLQEGIERLALLARF